MKARILSALLAVVLIFSAAALWFYIFKRGNRQDQKNFDTVRALTKGSDPQNGRRLILSVGCGACHEINGIPGASGKVGPSLKTFRDQAMVAGHLSNTAENLTLWLQNPRQVEPATAMPDLGLSPQDAGDIAAYLLAN